MTTNELLTTINYNEYLELRGNLQDKLTASLVRNGFGYRVARFSKVLVEMSKEVEAVNKEFEGFTYVY